MPKVVDHIQRRERIVGAVWDQLLAGGFEAVSLRKVADRAGISMGQVQHYFATREQMVQAALSLAAERLTAMIEGQIAAITTPTAEQSLRAMLAGFLGAEPESRRWVRIFAAILAHAVSDPATAELLAADNTELGRLTAELITASRAERGAAPSDRPDLDADLCWAIATSAGIEVALGQRTVASARELLDYHLEQLLTRA